MMQDSIRVVWYSNKMYQVYWGVYRIIMKEEGDDVIAHISRISGEDGAPRSTIVHNKKTYSSIPEAIFNSIEKIKEIDVEY